MLDRLAYFNDWKDGQSFTSTAASETVASTNSIDLSVHTQFIDPTLKILTVVRSFTGTGASTTISAKLQFSDDPAFGAGNIKREVDIMPATKVDDITGDTPMYIHMPTGILPQYVRVAYTTTGATASTSKFLVSTFFTNEVGSARMYFYK